MTRSDSLTSVTNSPCSVNAVTFSFISSVSTRIVSSSLGVGVGVGGGTRRLWAGTEGTNKKIRKNMTPASDTPLRVENRPFFFFPNSTDSSCSVVSQDATTDKEEEEKVRKKFPPCFICFNYDDRTIAPDAFQQIGSNS